MIMWGCRSGDRQDFAGEGVGFSNFVLAVS